MTRLAAMRIACSLALAACGGGSAALAAKPTAQPVAAADPEAARIYLDAVKQLSAKGEGAQDKALAGFEQALTRDPKLWEAHYNAGVVLRRRGELRKALPHLTAAHELAPADGEPLIALAEVQHALGDREEAADLLAEYVQEHPDANAVRIALTAVLREQGEFDKALTRAREALVREPANVQALLEVGRIYRQKGDLDVAELVFEKVLALDPKSATAHNDLGLLALARGDTQRAFDEFDKAGRHDERFTPARLNRASVLLRAGDYAAARSEYEKVLAVTPDDMDARVALGICLRGLGKPAEAEAEYQKALTAAPNHAAALFNLGVLRAEFQSRPADALPLFEKYLDVSAKDDPQRKAAERYLSELKAQAASAKEASP
jgi:tetratricopeptide (TPR) repeat protein